MQPEQTIEGVVERILYVNEETAWSVVRLSRRGEPEFTAVGNLLGVQPGESLRLTGRWVKDRKYGRQLKVEGYLSIQPATFRGIERYLGSGLIPGIGRTMAKRLVRHFGLETLDIIDREPARLAEVEGIGPKRCKLILESWSAQRKVRDVMVFLQSHGVSTTYAVRIYKRYGDEAIARVRENPYRLSREIRGIGFTKADRIASDLGIPHDSPHRAAAGVLHALTQATEQGHMYLPRPLLVEHTRALLTLEATSIEPAVDQLLDEGLLTATPLPNRDRVALFPTALAVAEAGVANLLAALLQRPAVPLKIDVQRAIRWFEEREEISLASQQRGALAQAIGSKVLVITGGPGTGKTTLVRGIVQILEAKGLRVVLAAPTGRAAKRLSEASGHDAKTVHRLLEYNPQEHRFTRGLEHPLHADLIVIDEASMLDTVLSYHVLQAVHIKARLIFVGDVDQLPSIGPGRVLADLIDAEVIDVARLTEVFRQAQQSQIVHNAHRVRQGLPLALPAAKSPEAADSDFFFIERRAPEEVLATLKHLVTERIPGSFHFDPQRAIQVLTPLQRGLLGAANLNAELQALLNPAGEAMVRGSRLLRVGDRVMQVRNNYDLDVFNGDIGRVEAIDRAKERMRVEIDGRSVGYDFSALDELVLAYACSIHKSQGSEYPCVVIPLHTQHYVMLERNLLYTALTRGKRLVVIVGSRRALQLAIETQPSVRRATLLAERLRSA